jgi:hypothetical protein
MVPRVRFTGDRFADLVSCIFAETLQDLLDKWEDGSGTYPRGYLHTSTMAHEGTCYHGQMWSRDCGRGVIELASLGFDGEALATARYFLSHITYGSHWARELHDANSGQNELDGNAMALLAICSAWAANGSTEALAAEFMAALAPVLSWVSDEMDASPYGGLLPSESELSGNPYTPGYVVYPIYANYGILVALHALRQMALACSDTAAVEKLGSLALRLDGALRARLVSDGVFSYAAKGCWVNALDGRDGSAYDRSDWVGSSWPVYHWTRQLPFIFDPDYTGFACDAAMQAIHNESYRSVQKAMCTGELFRKYGFVSNTGWTGMAGRHDETMCGYGQGFFTQAALLQDDINTYTKCLEGIARLGYDGAVAEPLTFDMNPWVMHECFNYENYEHGLDHTFGAMSLGRREVMDNPGDEGNLVQAAEVIKAIRLAVGAGARERRLVLTPRLPWMWESVEARDYPIVGADGSAERVSFTLRHERWLRKCTIAYDVPESFDGVDVRFGPFPSHIPSSVKKGFEIETCGNGSWIWVRGLKAGKAEYSVEL